MKDQVIERVQALSTIRKYELALAELAALIGEYPADAFLHTLKGAILKDEEKFAEAAEACQAALKIDASFVNAHNLLGVIEIEQGFASQAEKHLTIAHGIEPRNTAVLANLTRLYLLQSKPKKAVDYAEMGLTIEPEHQDLNNSLFLAYTSLNLTAEANEVLIQNLSRDPNHLETLFNQAVALMLKKQYHEAQIVLASLLKTDPNNEEVIQTFKEAATADNAFYRFVDGSEGTWTMALLTLGSWFYVLSQVDDAPSRFYWTLLLLMLIWVGWSGTYEGIGRLIAFFRRRKYWSLYSFNELLIATCLPVLLGFNVLLVYQSVHDILAPGPFPWLSFFGSIFLPLLQLGLGWLLDETAKVSRLQSTLLLLSLAATVSTFFLGPLWWAGLLGGLGMFGVCLFSRRAKEGR